MWLLDTHVLIWLLQGDAKLGKETRELIEGHRYCGEVLVSAATYWEIALLQKKRKLFYRYPLHMWKNNIEVLGIGEIALTGDVAFQAVALEDCHGDPADRFIMAAAIMGAATLLTADKKILAWSGSLQRRDARV